MRSYVFSGRADVGLRIIWSESRSGASPRTVADNTCLEEASSIKYALTKKRPMHSHVESNRSTPVTVATADPTQEKPSFHVCNSPSGFEPSWSSPSFILVQGQSKAIICTRAKRQKLCHNQQAKWRRACSPVRKTANGACRVFEILGIDLSGGYDVSRDDSGCLCRSDHSVCMCNTFSPQCQ